MIKQFNIPCSIILICGILFQGCKKFVEVDPPQNQLVTESVFENNSTATAAVTAIYTQLSSLANVDWLTGVSADELINYGASPEYQHLYTNSLVMTDGATIGSFLWKPFYNYIFQANAVLHGLEKSTGVTTAVKSQLQGEALFIRAMMHFYLFNLYGDIPVVSSTEYQSNLHLGREGRSKVFESVISDLETAKTLLNEQFLDAGNLPYDERVRPTKWAAAALLARAYLYNEQYPQAAAEASLVIGSPNFSLPLALDEVFLKNSTETIWQLMPAESRGFNTDEGRKFVLLDVPDQSTGVSLSGFQMDAFEPGDLRKMQWTDSIIAGAATYYFPTKYKIQSGTPVQEYSMVLRLSEQYLIRAEARTFQNDFVNANEDINLIRRRAGLNDIDAQTQEELIEAILHERQTELFTEGQRWFDLKRLKKIDEVMSTITPAKSTNTWQPFQQLYPLPEDDVKNSLSLTQNAGY